MDAPPSTGAWLESDQGQCTPIERTCYVGRSPANHIVLAQDKVSRRHAMINLQGEDEFWLVDLGSSNGTYLNGRRINQPCQLNDMDRVEIGGNLFIFHHPAVPRFSSPDTADLTDTDKTIQDIKSVPCWLLVADIEGSTQFTRKLPPEEAPKITTRWLENCRKIIEAQQGTINKFLGDGFLAFWIEREGVAPIVVQGVEELRKLQANDQPRFRIVLHFGKVFLGGGASLGEESLLGTEVNFIFRMEKVAASLGAPCLVSHPVHERLHTLWLTEKECQKSVPGFEGEFAFYVPKSTPANSP